MKKLEIIRNIFFTLGITLFIAGYAVCLILQISWFLFIFFGGAMCGIIGGIINEIMK